MQNCNHQIKDINTYILYLLYFLINALFITKYLMRINPSITLLVLSAYLLIGLLFLCLTSKIHHVSNRSLCFAILGFIILLQACNISSIPIRYRQTDGRQSTTSLII